MSKWTLFPADTDQHTVEIADHVGRVEVTVGSHVAHLDPTEARHMAGALLYAASCVETADEYREATTDTEEETK